MKNKLLTHSSKSLLKAKIATHIKMNICETNQENTYYCTGTGQIADN